MAIKVLRPVEWPAASSVLIEADLLNNAVQQVWMIRVYARVQYSYVHHEMNAVESQGLTYLV